ncbi:hypothetical protein [Lentzea sp. NPDC060358]|uniref:hypothetical protein n=1 Tax=Lentzea sp. NPDC060358 TaxID=3347103 RepID=UPI00366337D2
MFDDHFPRRRNRHGGRSLRGAPLWIKVTVWVGALLAIAGFGVLGYGFATTLDAFGQSFTTTVPPVGQFEPPSFASLKLGFGLFFAGFAVSAIGTLANNTRR